ncbi:hypothetical protein LMG29542_06994 [Paraburkholderia humisilvae]|uniref:Uncharacterized protein n=1 Tax=Paraburkholderia humisilvae TaxID=627669 RepID=A0A6J5F5N3_9BURK|nr:hypothetical protein LMG29542_06994 [Paraburkholderia humisilvae]
MNSPSTVVGNCKRCEALTLIPTSPLNMFLADPPSSRNVEYRPAEPLTPCGRDPGAPLGICRGKRITNGPFLFASESDCPPHLNTLAAYPGRLDVIVAQQARVLHVPGKKIGDAIRRWQTPCRSGIKLPSVSRACSTVFFSVKRSRGLVAADTLLTRIPCIAPRPMHGLHAKRTQPNVPACMSS